MQESAGSAGDAAHRSPDAIAERLRLIRDLAYEQADAFELLGPRGENVASLVHLVRDLGQHAQQGLADLGLAIDS